MAQDRQPPKRRKWTLIGFVLDQYPKLSETFILQEILGLERRGCRLFLWALQDPGEQVRSEGVGRVEAPGELLPVWMRRFPLQVVAAHLRLLFTFPRGYLKAWRRSFQLRSFRHPTAVDAVKDFVLAGALAGRARDNGVGHLHAHYALQSATLAHLASLMTGLSFSFTTHAFDLYCSEGDYLARQISEARFVVTCTESNRVYLEEQVLDRPCARLHTVYHGVDLTRFKPGSRTLEGPPTILAVGRLVEKKDLPCLVEACSLLRDQGVPYRCRIVGYGPDEARVRALIEKRGLDDLVAVEGPLPQELLSCLYQRVDLVALPAKILTSGDRDGLPNVLVEAMACGLPVVSTPVSAIPELVEDGNNGLLVPPGQPQALAAALKRLLLDPSLRSRLGKNARLKVEQEFDAEQGLDRLAQLFSRVLPARKLGKAAE